MSYEPSARRRGACFRLQNLPRHFLRNIHFSCKHSCTCRRGIRDTRISVSCTRTLRSWPPLRLFISKDPIFCSRHPCSWRRYGADNDIGLCTSPMAGVNCHLHRRDLDPYLHIPCSHNHVAFEWRQTFANFAVSTNKYLFAVSVSPIPMGFFFDRNAVSSSRQQCS